MVCSRPCNPTSRLVGKVAEAALKSTVSSRSDVSCRVERFYAGVGSVGLGLLTVALDRGNGLHTQEQVKLA